MRLGQTLRLFIGVTLATWLGFPAVGLAQLATYDAFSGAAIDSLRWRGVESSAAAVSNFLDLVNTESHREIVDASPGLAVDRQLQLFLRTTGGTSSNVGSTGEGRNGVRINHPTLQDGLPRITTLKAKVTVRSAKAQNCAANANPTRARATVFAFFFNDGTSTEPGNAAGDMLAGVNVERSSKFGDRIVAFVNRCDSSNCAFSTNLSFAIMGPWTLGVASTVTVRWAPANNRFVFSATGLANKILTYTQADTNLPRIFLHELRVSNDVPNCSAGRRMAAIAALFDNVRINSNAVPPLAMVAPSAAGDAVEEDAEDD